MDGNILTLYHNQSKHVEVINYPDGQRSCKIDLQYFDVKKPIGIVCSIRNFGELEVLCCIIAALRKNDRTIGEIKFAYLFGMRSDRAFNVGEPNYMRDVVCPIIDSFNISYDIYMPHSINFLLSSLNCRAKLIPTLKEINFPHIKIGGDQSVLIETDFKFHKKRIEKDKLEVFLDKHSISRIKKMPSEIGLLICDDLCDAGGTFIEESKYLKNLFPDKKIYLYVAHGLFTKGIDHVANHFDHIYTTNSYQEFDHPKVTAIKVI